MSALFDIRTLQTQNAIKAATVGVCGALIYFISKFHLVLSPLLSAYLWCHRA